MKALYRHKESGDLFAIETDADGSVVSASGPLMSDKLDPRVLDYDDYWNTELQAKLADFAPVTKDAYRQLLRDNGFFPQITQKTLF